MDHGRKYDSWAIIKLGSEEHRAWIAYFNRLRWMPLTLKTIAVNKDMHWTAPCEWPDSLP